MASMKLVNESSPVLLQSWASAVNNESQLLIEKEYLLDKADISDDLASRAVSWSHIAAAAAEKAAVAEEKAQENKKLLIEAEFASDWASAMAEETAVLWKKQYKMCANCKIVKGNKKCGGCMAVKYCSYECAKYHWDNEHHHVCSMKRDEVHVSHFYHLGVKYYRDINDVVYNLDGEKIGVWNKRELVRV